MKARQLCAVVALLALSACSQQQTGEKYLGAWVSTADARNQLTITADGQRYRIDTTKPPLWKGEREPITVWAELRDGSLIPQGWGGATALNYDSNADTLLAQRPGGGVVIFARQ